MIKLASFNLSWRPGLSKKAEGLASNNIKRLVIKFSIPAILALLIQSFYNIIDTVYVGHAIGSLGIAAMTIVYPIQLLMLAIANLAAIGGGALISISLGKKDYNHANKIAGNVLISVVVAGIILTILSLIYIDPIITFFGASPRVFPFVKNYMSVAFSCTIITLLLQAIFPLLRAEGKLKIIMVTTILSVVLNIILAPIFLFQFKWGMWGVSIATQTSKLLILVIIIFYYLTGKTIIQTKLKHFIPDFKLITKSVLLGMSSFIRTGGSALTNILIIYIAGKYGGPEGIAAFGLAFRIIIFLFMPILGFIQASQPIIGFNLGANRKHNIKKTLNFTMTVSICLSLVFLFFVVVFINDIVILFGNNPMIIRDTPKYLIGLTIALPLIAFQAIISGYLQAVGKIVASNIVTVLRQFLFFIPLMLILSYYFKMNGLTASYFVSNLITFTILFIWMEREKRVFLSK